MVKETIKIEKIEKIEIKDEDGKVYPYYIVRIEERPDKIKGFMEINLTILKNHLGWDFEEGDELEVEDIGVSHEFTYKDKSYRLPKITFEGTSNR